MGYGCGGGDAANDRKKEQVVEDYKQQVSFDWKSETEDRAYCFGSEWPEILWLDVPRAIGPFQDRVELRYISFIEARVIPVGELGVRLLCGKEMTLFIGKWQYRLQFPLTGSLKLKIGHIVLVLSGWRYCCLMSLEHSDPSKIGVLAFFLEVGRPLSMRQARTRLGTYVYNEVLSLHIYAVAATQAKTHSGNMSPTSPRSRIVYSGYSVPQALQNNAQSNFSSGHDSLKLLSSILKKRLTQINGHAPCT
ncbi:hypothetical protein TRIUR3_24806 [Triticum urartu]|uniref:Uncharacterized protein n=1 Tax=Triticum urartu TaxID=4572 RepID=M7ZV21_TRIUA|nr:hypothetical protein TRIUR3_24806 [Triticum urartu]